MRVGAVIERNGGAISMGWNGTPSGAPSNECEARGPDGELLTKEGGRLVTKPEVIHAELNALLKLAAGGGNASGSTMYLSHSPCPHCAGSIRQAGIARVVFRSLHKDDGVELLRSLGVRVDHVPLEPEPEIPDDEAGADNTRL
jgi:dCMP deaminase